MSINNIHDLEESIKLHSNGNNISLQKTLQNELNNRGWCSEEKEFQSLFPESTRYISNLIPVNLFEYLKSPQVLTGLPYIFVRDGVIPLLKFFQKHKNPPRDFPLMLIHENLVDIVPEEWEQNIKTYNFYWNDKTFRIEPLECDSIIFKININNFSVIHNSISTMESTLKNLTIDRTEKKNYLLPIISPTSFQTPSSPHKTLLNVWEWMRKTVNNIELLEWKDISKINLSHAYFMNFHSNQLMLMDQFSDFDLIYRGASPLQTTKQTKNRPQGLQVPISPRHGVIISTEKIEKKIQSFNETIDSIESFKNEFGINTILRKCRSDILEKKWFELCN